MTAVTYDYAPAAAAYIVILDGQQIGTVTRRTGDTWERGRLARRTRWCLDGEPLAQGYRSRAEAATYLLMAHADLTPGEAATATGWNTTT